MLSSISRWDSSRQVNRSDGFLYGDAISDLKTTNNTLSVWKADSQTDIEDALVALALCRDNVDKIIYCMLDEKSLDKMEISLSAAKLGDGPGLDSATLSKHRDLIELDYWRLGFLTEYMIDHLKSPANRLTFTKKQIQNLLITYKNNNRIDISKMRPKLKSDLKW